MAKLVKLNSLKPTFTFTKNGETVLIENLPLNTLDDVEKVLYENIADVEQVITVEISNPKALDFGDYISKPKTKSTPIETQPKMNVDGMLNNQTDVDI